MTWQSVYTNVTSWAANDWLIGQTNAGGGQAAPITTVAYKGSDGAYHAAGDFIATGTYQFSGGSLISGIAGIAMAGGLSTGRISSSGGGTLASLHSYQDASAIEIIMGSSNGFQSGIVIAASSYSGTGTDAVRIYTHSALRLEITGAGVVQPGADNTLTLGSSGKRWSVVYAGTGSINTSDEREKQQIEAIGDDLLDAWAAVEWRRFRFNDAVAEKGEDARWHFGAIAQQIRDVIDAALGEGAAVRLGLCCFDQWEEIPPTEAVAAVDEVRDEDGTVIVQGHGEIAADPGLAAGDRWGLRYEECFAVEAAYQRRRMDQIEARLAALGA